jgi:NAD(P)-dependent dehydrogenase (short-subunit alcohol dehydrogenase family)
MNSLQGNIALVTGGAQGIGFGVCQALGQAGASLVIADVQKDRARSAGDKLLAMGFQCEISEVDVTSEDSVRALVTRLKETRLRVDILVTCAGIPPNVVPTIRLSAEEWHRVLAVNLDGVFLCCREVGRLMVEQNGGCIVNIASLNAVSPAALCAAYNVSKAGVVSLTQSLAVELAPFGVRVNAVSPGPTETEFHDTVMPQRAATLGITRDQMVERVRASIPLGRWGKPSDVANAVLFLCSAESGWITGQNFVVAGGLAGVSAAPARDVILGKQAPAR